MMNNQDKSKAFKQSLKHHCKSLSNIQKIKSSGTNSVIFLYGSETRQYNRQISVLKLKYDKTHKGRVKEAKRIEHNIYDGAENTMKFQDIIPTCHKKYFIIIYKGTSQELKSYVVWNIKKGMEHSSFITQEEDHEQLSYLTSKNSKLGYILFNQYLLYLDTGLVNPYFAHSIDEYDK